MNSTVKKVRKPISLAGSELRKKKYADSGLAILYKVVFAIAATFLFISKLILYCMIIRCCISELGARTVW